MKYHNKQLTSCEDQNFGECDVTFGNKKIMSARSCAVKYTFFFNKSAKAKHIVLRICFCKNLAKYILQ